MQVLDICQEYFSNMMKINVIYIHDSRWWLNRYHFKYLFVLDWFSPRRMFVDDWNH
jgi:hypothetical protein